MTIKKELTKFISSFKNPKKLIPYLKKKINRIFYLSEEQFLDKFFSNKNHKFVIQVGGNDGVQNDPLRKYFLNKNNYSAIIFEPLNYYYNCLKDLYKDRSDIKVEKYGISNIKKKKTLYFIDPNIADEMNGEGPMNNWAHGQGSFDKDIIEFHIDQNNFRGDIYKTNINRFKKNIISEEIDIILLSEVETPGVKETLLVIDVQGFELEVILSLNFKKLPKYIFFENDYKDVNKTKKIINLLEKYEYKYIGGEHDLVYEKKIY